MKAKLVGVQGIRFTNSNGEEVRGTNVFVTFADENVQGVKCEKLWLKEGIAIPKDVKLNESIELIFNMKGKVEAISKA